MNAISRRELLQASLLACATEGVSPPLSKAQPKNEDLLKLPAKAVTKGPKHHFFGYYDKCPWDATGRYLLANEIGFAARQPDANEELTVGMVDLKDVEKFIPLAKTRAWCWQQGTMLQWLGSAPEREVIFNSITDKQPSATILDIRSLKKRTLPLPIYALSTDGKQAVSLDFARLHRLRPGYGYASYTERSADEAAPEKLGIWWMDVVSGKHELIVNLKQLAAFKPDERFKGAHHWVNHLQFSPGGKRFVFLHRWKAPEGKGGWQTRMLTAKPDGSDLRITFDDGMISHFDWKDDTTILAWARVGKQNHFYEANVLTGETKIIGADVLPQDGHCSYSPDRKWILNDTYPDKNRLQTLMLYKVANGRRFNLNKFLSPKQFTGPARCDLHPRWNRTGTQVCFDGSHDEQRQVYVVDVADVVGS